MGFIKAASAVALSFFLAISSLNAVSKPVTQPANDPAPAAPVTAAPSAKVEGLEIIPGNISVPTSQRAVVMKAVAKKTVKWIVVSNTKVTYLEIPQTKQLVIFPNDSPDTIFVYAFSALDSGEPTDPALAVITVQGAKPPPIPPKPDPPTPPKPDPPVVHDGKFLVTYIVDNSASNIAEVSRIVDSKELVDGMTSRGHARIVRDVSSARIDALKLRKFVESVESGPPLMIVQVLNPGKVDHGKVIHVSALPDSPADVLSVLDQIGGK